MNFVEMYTLTSRPLKAATASAVLYLALLFGVNTLASNISDKISSQSELEVILGQEKRKLGNTQNIKAVLSDTPISFSGITKEGELKIVVGGEFACRPAVRHELYHIHDGHIGNDSILIYYFWTEPQATLYSLTGIQL